MVLSRVPVHAPSTSTSLNLQVHPDSAVSSHCPPEQISFPKLKSLLIAAEYSKVQPVPTCSQLITRPASHKRFPFSSDVLFAAPSTAHTSHNRYFSSLMFRYHQTGAAIPHIPTLKTFFCGYKATTASKSPPAESSLRWTLTRDTTITLLGCISLPALDQDIAELAVAEVALRFLDLKQFSFNISYCRTMKIIFLHIRRLTKLEELRIGGGESQTKLHPHRISH